MKVWKTQNRKKKDRFVGLPPNKRFCLTPLARHSMMLSQNTRIEAQREHHKACESHISLTYFLCIGILWAIKLSRQSKTSICKEKERDDSNLNI